MVARTEGPSGHQGARRSGTTTSTDGGPAYCTMCRMSDELPAYAERVLEAVESIPPGRVMTYGDVAEWLGEGGPRQVGRVMALYGGAVPWWRVVRADGMPLPGHEARALEHYRTEATPLRPTAGGEPRLDMRRARWDGYSGPDGGPGGQGGGPGGPDGGRDEAHT
ncbi:MULTISPECIES: MGMT family protein [Streptomyces]|uniref:MGMT family protein n=1 Tax=Streptomyces TaxID=1883 RepID=UPI00160074D4